MKLSFVISLEERYLNYSSDIGKLGRKLSLLSDLGYQGVELGIRSPNLVNIKALRKALEKNKLKLCALATGRMYTEEGLSLSSLNKQIRINSIRRLKEHIDFAHLFDSQIIIGLVRGKKEIVQAAPRRYERNLIESTKCLCDYAVSKDVDILIEPLNRYETDFLNNSQESVDFIKELKCKKLKLLLDAFHMNIEEGNLLKAIEKGKRFLAHIHLADNNRRCPSEGSLDFKQIIFFLKQLGYTGYLSGEMLLIPSIEHCISKFSKIISPLL